MKKEINENWLLQWKESIGEVTIDELHQRIFQDILTVLPKDCEIEYGFKNTDHFKIKITGRINSEIELDIKQ